MAHHRRKKPRIRTSAKRYDKWREKELAERGVHHYWLSSWPAWHDIQFHRRPHRRYTKTMEHRVLSAAIDPDEACWPLAKKPHIWFW